MHARALVAAAALSCLAPGAFAQVQTISSDSFTGAAGNLGGSGGGTGWSNDWFVTGGGGDLLKVDPGVTGWAGADGVGNYVRQNVGDGQAYRRLDLGAHGDVAFNGVAGLELGADGSTVWISFSTERVEASGNHYGGLSLFQVGVGERFFIGSPWASNGWGIQPNGGSAVIVPGSDNSVPARLVTRIDHAAGNERLRLWVDPADAHPTCDPDLDVTIPNLSWNEVRFASGNAGVVFHWDDLRIEKGAPAFTQSQFCIAEQSPNESGNIATLAVTGSGSRCINDNTIVVSGTSPGRFGVLLQSEGVQTAPYSSPNSLYLGTVCIGNAPSGIGPIQRLRIVLADGTGTAQIPLDFLATGPLAGLETTTMAGVTMYYQWFHRDFSLVVNPPTGHIGRFGSAMSVVWTP